MIRILLEGLVTSVLLAAVVGVVCLIGRRRLSPAVCHALWLVVVVKLLLPPLMAWPWALRDGAMTVGSGGSPSGIVEQAQWWLLLDETRTRVGHGNAAVPTAAPVVTGAAAPVTAGPMAAAATPAAEPVAVAPAEPWLTPARLRAGLVGIWIAGGALFVLLQSLRTLRLGRWLRGAASDGPLTAQVAAMAAELGIVPPRAYTVARLDSPYVWSLGRTFLIWPADLDVRGAEARGLLAHELAHLRRRDHWVGWVMLLAGAIWWWNPVYWLARRRLHQNAELCCDAWAVRHLRDSRRVYASALLDISQRAVMRRVPALALGVRATRSELERRLTMIMTGNPALRPNLAAWCGAMGLLALALPAWSQALTPPKAKLPFSIAKETTVITEPLRADGLPDYVAALNEKYGKGVTPENNGLLPFMKIHGTAQIIPDATSRTLFLKMAGAPESPAEEEHFKSFASYLTDHPCAIKPEKAMDVVVAAEREMWTAQTHPELAAYVKSQEAIFNLGVEVSKRSRFYCPFVSADGTLLNANVPKVVGMAEFLRTWATRATFRAANGDIVGAAEDLRAMKQFGRLLPQSGIIINMLLGYLSEAIGTDAASIIITSGKLTAGQCEALGKALEMPPLPPLTEAFGTLERWRALQAIQLIVTDRVKFNEVIRIDQDMKTLDLARIDGDAFLKGFNKYWDRQVTVFKSTNRAFINAVNKGQAQELLDWRNAAQKFGATLAPDEGETKSDYTERMLQTYITIIVPNLGSRAIATLDYQWQSDMLPVLLAAAKAKAQGGAWPKALEELVPAYLKEVPVDPYGANNAKVRYVMINNRPRVYSVGVDQKAGTSDDVGIGEPLPVAPAPAATRASNMP